MPLFRSVVYDDVWPGIDVSFRRAGEALEYDFVVAPGASPNAIRLAYENARTLRVDASGNLRLETSVGPVTDHRPISYQVVGGKRVPVPTRFRLERGTTRYGLDVGRYDRTRPLVIDPGIIWAASVGGGASQDVTVDAAGNAYVVGSADTRGGPATPTAFDGSFNGVVDAFVAKVNPAGNALLYWTFIGGAGIDDAHAIAIDSSGNAFITGRTESSDYPTTAGAFYRSHGGSNDVFVSKLSADGSALLYSTFLGGSGFDTANNIAVDGAGSAYVGGHAQSGYPTTAGALQTVLGGVGDAFVTKLNLGGSGLVYSTLLGGSAHGDDIRNLVVDAQGNVTAAGETDATDFPTTANAIDATYNGDRDVIVSTLNPQGSALLYSTFLGGPALDIAEGVDVDPDGNVYLTGLTHSIEFPVTGGNPAGADGDAFVTSLAANTLRWSYVYAGTGRQFGLDLELDSARRTYVAGNAEGSQQVFLLRVSFDGTQLYETEFGGSGLDRLIANGVAAGEGGVAYVAAQTFSDNFPYTPGALANTPDDAFLVKIDTNPEQPLQITGVAELADPVGKYGRFEATIELSETFDNPFDPAEIAVDVTFTSPSGRVQTRSRLLVPALHSRRAPDWENYSSAGAPGWRVRFAPDETGTYTYSIGAVAGSRTGEPGRGQLPVEPRRRAGFVRIDDRNDLYLRFDSGDPYLPDRP